jgi:hypothetical protein
MYDIAHKIKCPTLILAGEKIVLLQARLRSYMTYSNVPRNTFYLQARKEQRITVM